MAGNPMGGELQKDLSVLAAGSSNNYSFNIEGKARNNMGWVQNSFFFTANSTTTTLTFTSLESDAYGPVLDNVRLSAIPIPGAVWLLCSGLIGIVGIRRKFRK